jgi:hypothetical protein
MEVAVEQTDSTFLNLSQAGMRFELKRVLLFDLARPETLRQLMTGGEIP